jgi:hypothetical protein
MSQRRKEMNIAVLFSKASEEMPISRAIAASATPRGIND